MADGRQQGIVKWFDNDRGFGFIARHGNEDIYVNIRDVQQAGLQTLESGDKVSFTVGQTSQGDRAENLKMEEAATFRFGTAYLSNGYFDQDNGERYLRDDLVDTLARQIGKTLSDRGMKPNQIRRFFNKARGIESKLDRAKSFNAVKADIASLKRDVAYQVGRDLVPEEFKQFIDRNAELAMQDKESFQRGFLQHFESVLAYFVYYHNKSKSSKRR